MPRIGGPRGPQGAPEHAKNFKGTLNNILAYLKQYKVAMIFVILFAVGSTIFSIVGPKILGNATTELFNGITSKISGGPGIDFNKIGNILLLLLILI